MQMQTDIAANAERAGRAALPREVSVAGVTCCPHCGRAAETVIKRGAIVVTSDPLEILWNDRPVPLSPTEAQVFRTIAVRGRATYAAIDAALEAFGSNPATRPVVMMRIRRKFAVLGCSDPFVRLGQHGVRLRIEADANGSAATVIGMDMDQLMIDRGYSK
ncbi:MAG: hypothetical protein EOP58_00595 [Sphingomonadales bacterium]|nr:MAG: hypothetical protein EOP58_00595 [Sphingomonadales bacterium]